MWMWMNEWICEYCEWMWMNVNEMMDEWNRFREFDFDFPFSSFLSVLFGVSHGKSDSIWRIAVGCDVGTRHVRGGLQRTLERKGSFFFSSSHSFSIHSWTVLWALWMDSCCVTLLHYGVDGVKVQCWKNDECNDWIENWTLTSFTTARHCSTSPLSSFFLSVLFFFFFC